MTGYYDIVLGLIPLALVGITGTLSFAGVALTTAVPLAATVAVGLIGHAMFINSPVDTPSSTQSSQSQSPINSAD